MTMAHLIKRRPLPALCAPLCPAQPVTVEAGFEPSWQQDVRDFVLAYFAGLLAFGIMLA